MALESTHSKQVIVQISPVNSRQLKFLDITALKAAFQNDPDLVNIDAGILPQVFRTLFVCTGCDYISFFSQIGKATFLRYYFQYATFISGRECKGTLADTEEESCNRGFLAFLRLIGTVYFKKHATCFETQSPVRHFQNFASETTWLEEIRQSIWHRISFENEMIPSNEALFFHWKRSCWILQMWRQSDKNTMVLRPITEYGWDLNDGKLTVIWDTQTNMQAIRDRVNLLLRGCKCVTGCSTGRCSCRRSKRQCSEGCQCVNCSNTVIATIDSNPDLAEIAIEELAVTEEPQYDNTEELMDWVFGPEVEESDSDSV